MNEQQTVAITNPCELPDQCNHPRYRRVFYVGRYAVSTMLTVNVGEE